MVPGTPGLEHRIGGLEKEYLTGNVSYAPANHEQMVRVRARKIAGIAAEIPPTEVHGAPQGDLLVVGWGSTYGAIAAAVQDLQRAGQVGVARPPALPQPAARRSRETSSRRFKKVLVPEMNLGQLVKVLRAEYLVDAVGLNKIQGLPFKVSEIANRINRMLEA